MKKVILFLAAAVTSVSVVASDTNIFSGWSFFAPEVTNEQTYNDALDAGDIVYDSTENKFYGKTGTGNSWVEFGGAASTDAVTSPGATAPVIVRARLAAPSGGSCTVTSESGDWIDGTPNSTGTGFCTITVTSGTFSADPTCVCTSETSARMCSFSGSPSSTSISTAIHNADGTAENRAVSIICMQ